MSHADGASPNKKSSGPDETGLRISPKSLSFEIGGGKDENPQVGTVRIANPSTNHVTFKVKTNRPTRYYVRPIVGILKPFASTLVEIHLLPLKGVVPDKSDRFLIASTIVSSLAVDPKAIWKSIEPEKCTQHRLRCDFVTPDGADASAAVPRGTSPRQKSPNVESTPLVSDGRHDEGNFVGNPTNAGVSGRDTEIPPPSTADSGASSHGVDGDDSSIATTNAWYSIDSSLGNAKILTSSSSPPSESAVLSSSLNVTATDNLAYNSTVTSSSQQPQSGQISGSPVPSSLSSSLSSSAAASQVSSMPQPQHAKQQPVVSQAQMSSVMNDIAELRETIARIGEDTLVEKNASVRQIMELRRSLDRIVERVSGIEENSRKSAENSKLQQTTVGDAAGSVDAKKNQPSISSVDQGGISKSAAMIMAVVAAFIAMFISKFVL